MDIKEGPYGYTFPHISGMTPHEYFVAGMLVGAYTMGGDIRTEPDGRIAKLSKSGQLEAIKDYEKELQLKYA